MSKRYQMHRPSCTLEVGGKSYRHGDDITELGPDYWERFGRPAPEEEVAPTDEEE